MNKHIIYLAAGNSRRFGANKLLYNYRGKPLYRYGMELLSDYCQKHKDCSFLVVSQYQEILLQAEREGISGVYSPYSHKGMSFTIEAALHALGNVPEEDFIVFVVADQPYLTEDTLDKLISVAAPEIETVSVKYGETPGNPTMFSARLIPELLALKEDEGGRKVIHRHSCVFVEAGDKKELYDIDTPECI